MGASRANRELDDPLTVLPPGTARAWRALAQKLPDQLYLGGGTAVAVHLRHRESRDLDFFFHDSAVDLQALAKELSTTGDFALTSESTGTLRGLFRETKVEFFHADEGAPQHLLEQTQTVSGLRVAGLKDLMAMKLKVVGDRGELRDYYDIKAIEQQAGLTVEDGIALYTERYGIAGTSDTLPHVVSALGYLDDIEEDDALPIGKDELAAWWKTRQARLVRHLSRNPL
jgi:predicted nucleotidyltransferase component of viral defense system